MRSWHPKPTSRGSGTGWPQGCTRVNLYQFVSILLTCDLTLLIFVDWMQSNCSTMFWTAFRAYLSCQWACEGSIRCFFNWNHSVKRHEKLSIFDALSCIIMPQQTNETMSCGFVNRTLIGYENWKKPKYLQSVKQLTKPTKHFICAGTLVG